MRTPEMTSHTMRGTAAALNRQALRTRRGSAWRLEHVALEQLQKVTGSQAHSVRGLTEG